MRFIGRAFVIFFAFLASCITAGLTIGFSLLAGEWQLLHDDPVARVIFWVTSVVGMGFAGAASFLPLLLLAVMAEAFRWRSILLYALAGIVIAFSAYWSWGFWSPYEESIDQPGPVFRGIEIVIAAGVVFGLTYWLIAGRRAGAWRRAPGI